MNKFSLSIFIFLILTISFDSFSHEGEHHEHDESPANSPLQLESGNGWQLVRSLEMGTSGKFVHMVLIDHNVYTDKTVYSSAINRLCRNGNEFCRIRFWSEERFVPETVALTIEQNKQLRADYLVNKSAGISHLHWSCSVDPDKSHCF